jgi:hypothetical protein
MLGCGAGGRDLAQPSRLSKGQGRIQGLRNSSFGKSKQASLVHGVNKETGFECV